MSETLSSWKEIANYLRRGVRTVQRWEQSYGLPVHRPAGRDRSAVFALTSEIDAWQKSCPQKEMSAGVVAHAGFTRDSQAFQRMHKNAQKTRQQTSELQRRTERLAEHLRTVLKHQERFDAYRKGHPRAS